MEILNSTLNNYVSTEELNDKLLLGKLQSSVDSITDLRGKFMEIKDKQQSSDTPEPLITGTDAATLRDGWLSSSEFSQIKEEYQMYFDGSVTVDIENLTIIFVYGIVIVVFKGTSAFFQHELRKIIYDQNMLHFEILKDSVSEEVWSILKGIDADMRADTSDRDYIKLPFSIGYTEEIFDHYKKCKVLEENIALRNSILYSLGVVPDENYGKLVPLGESQTVGTIIEKIKVKVPQTALASADAASDAPVATVSPSNTYPLSGLLTVNTTHIGYIFDACISINGKATILISKSREFGTHFKLNFANDGQITLTVCKEESTGGPQEQPAGSAEYVTLLCRSITNGYIIIDLDEQRKVNSIKIFARTGQEITITPADDMNSFNNLLKYILLHKSKYTVLINSTYEISAGTELDEYKVNGFISISVSSLSGDVAGTPPSTVVTGQQKEVMKLDRISIHVSIPINLKKSGISRKGGLVYSNPNLPTFINENYPTILGEKLASVTNERNAKERILEFANKNKIRQQLEDVYTTLPKDSETVNLYIKCIDEELEELNALMNFIKAHMVVDDYQAIGGGEEQKFTYDRSALVKGIFYFRGKCFEKAHKFFSDLFMSPGSVTSEMNMLSTPSSELLSAKKASERTSLSELLQDVEHKICPNVYIRAQQREKFNDLFHENTDLSLFIRPNHLYKLIFAIGEDTLYPSGLIIRFNDSNVLGSGMNSTATLKGLPLELQQYVTPFKCSLNEAALEKLNSILEPTSEGLTEIGQSVIQSGQRVGPQLLQAMINIVDQMVTTVEEWCGAYGQTIYVSPLYLKDPNPNPIGGIKLNLQARQYSTLVSDTVKWNKLMKDNLFGPEYGPLQRKSEVKKIKNIKIDLENSVFVQIYLKVLQKIQIQILR